MITHQAVLGYVLEHHQRFACHLGVFTSRTSPDVYWIHAHFSMLVPADPRSWSIEQVVLALEDLGLGHIAPAFRTNAVTGADLVMLSQQELQDLLGLTPLQARKVHGRVGCAKRTNRL